MLRFVSLIVITAMVSAGLVGCAKRIEIVTIEKERIDQDLSKGNKGFLKGTPPQQKEPKERGTKRTYYQVTIEMPPYVEWRDYPKTVDEELWGNRGYIYGGPQTITPQKGKKEAKQEEGRKEAIILPMEDEPADLEEDVELIIPEDIPATEPAYTEYVVKKGDTLGKISQKVYGTSKKWQLIYNTNRNIIKGPDKIYPGQKLKIPRQ